MPVLNFASTQNCLFVNPVWQGQDYTRWDLWQIGKGSEAAKNSSPNVAEGYKLMQQKIIESGKLQLIDNKYVFIDNVLFNSASQAAMAVVGYNINGRVNWKDSNGKSLKEIEESKVV